VARRNSRALRRRLLVVDVAVTQVLLAPAHATGGHAGLAENDRAGITTAQELEQLLHLLGRNSGVVTGPLRDRVPEGDDGVAQAGHQGPRRVTAKLAGVIGDVPVFHGVE